MIRGGLGTQLARALGGFGSWGASRRRKQESLADSSLKEKATRRRITDGPRKLEGPTKSSHLNHAGTGEPDTVPGETEIVRGIQTGGSTRLKVLCKASKEAFGVSIHI